MTDTQQFKHAKVISDLLESCIDHMKVKWQLCQSIGYLPDTNVFDRTLERLSNCKAHINSAELSAIELLNHVDTPKFPIKYLHNLRGFLYYDIEDISDMVNALNYIFLNRMAGIVASEPTLGTETESRPFGGIQLVYNATEALMKDYANTIKNVEYRGIVVFGFKNRAITYPPLVLYPSYAEHDLEYMLILAHEAYHIVQDEIVQSDKISDETVNELRSMRKDLQEELIKGGLASLYLPETVRDKNAPDALIADVLADDILADVYATIVAGESFPRISCDYYIPIMLDTSTRHAYSTFVVGSLKIRVAVATLEGINEKWGDENINKVIKEVNIKIKAWEELSEKIASEQSGSTEFSGLKDKLDSICGTIKSRNIPERMTNLIEKPYYPKDGGKRAELKTKLEEVTKILEGEPTIGEMAKIWKGDVLAPRHLISLLADRNNNINRNIVLIAMGYHKNILSRFTPRCKYPE